MLNHSLVTKAKQKIAKARDPIHWLPLVEPRGTPLAEEKRARFSYACGNLRKDMRQAEFDAVMAAIHVRHAFLIDGYVGLMSAINGGERLADGALKKCDKWR
jgi:hypothetical protein